MPFTIPTYDELLNNILTDYANQQFRDPNGNIIPVDTSKGSLVYVKAAASASALWGLYQYQRWVINQIFPDSSDTENLEHHAYVRGLSRRVNETDAELLTRLLERLRTPPAGGNKYDYATWAEEITGVTTAWVVPLGQGPGTTDVVLLADAVITGSEIPDTQLLADVRAHLVDICPTDVKYVRVLAPEIITQDVTVNRTGADYPAALAIQDITDYLNFMDLGAPLFLPQLASRALGGGSGDAEVVTPAQKVEPTAYQMIRPGNINVT